MDPQEITDLPLHAVQHPFVYDGVFKVRVYYGSKGHKQQSLHARMDGKDLHRHITDGTSPTGQEDADGLFYASQLVHYGLPTDRLQPRAIRTLKDIFKMRNGTPTLHVPDTIRVIERKLKKEYETLVSKSNVSRLLDENQVEIEALQTKLAALRKAFKAEEQDLLATLKPLEVLSTKYKAQLASIDEAKKAVNEEVKNENDVASDVEDDLPSAQTAGGKKRKQAEGIQRSSELPSRADASQKRTRIYTPSEPPVRREMTILPTPGTPVQNYQRRFQNQQPASATRKRTPVAHSPNAQRKATPARRFDSNVRTHSNHRYLGK